MWKSHATSHVSVKENVECWRATITLQRSLKMWVVSRYRPRFVLFPYPLHTTVLICLSSDSPDTKRSIHQLLDASTTLKGWGSSSTSGVGRVSVIRLYRIIQVRGLPEESRSRLTNVFVLLVQNLTKGPPWLIQQTNHDAAHPSPPANAATRHAPIIRRADTHYRTQLAHSAPSPPSQTARPPRSLPLITSPSSTT